MNATDRHSRSLKWCAVGLVLGAIATAAGGQTLPLPPSPKATTEPRVPVADVVVQGNHLISTATVRS